MGRQSEVEQAPCYLWAGLAELPGGGSVGPGASNQSKARHWHLPTAVSSANMVLGIKDKTLNSGLKKNLGHQTCTGRDLLKDHLVPYRAQPVN